MLLYAKTDAVIQPDNIYQMHGNQISVRTLDLNLPFAEIAAQMDRIAESHFNDVKNTCREGCIKWYIIVLLNAKCVDVLPECDFK